MIADRACRRDHVESARIDERDIELIHALLTGLLRPRAFKVELDSPGFTDQPSIRSVDGQLAVRRIQGKYGLLRCSQGSLNASDDETNAI